MIFRACIKDHQPNEHDHVRQSIERGIEKASKAGYSTRETGNLTVEHVEQISDYQYDSGPDELAESEYQARSDINRYPDESQDVWAYVSARQPTQHRVDDSLARFSYTCTKHLRS